MKHDNKNALLRNNTCNGTEAMRKVWAEEQLVQKWLDVEAAVAAAQLELGLLPPKVADAIIDCCSVKRVSPELVKKWLDVDTAVAAARLELGLLQPDAAASPIVDYYSVERDSPELIASHKPQMGNLMVAFTEAFAEVCGPAGEMLHLGVTTQTQDTLETGILLQIQEATKLIQEALEQLEASLCELADRHKHTVMRMCHAQHATAVTFGFKAAVWASEIADHAERLASAARHLKISNVSGAVSSNASYHFLLSPEEKTAPFRSLVAERLGLEVSPFDLHQRTDRFTELVQALSMIGTTLGCIGLEIRELQCPGIKELEEPHNVEALYAGGTMLIKPNAFLCEWQEVTMQEDRDDTCQAVEMAVIPESFLLAASALNIAKSMLGGLVVQHGVAMAEPEMLALYRHMGKKLEAQRISYEKAMQALEREQDPDVAGQLDAEQREDLIDPETDTSSCAAQVDAYLAARRERIILTHGHVVDSQSAGKPYDDGESPQEEKKSEDFEEATAQ